MENRNQPCSTFHSHCPPIVHARRLTFSHDSAPTCMPHIAAHWCALWPATKTQSRNCPRNPAIDLRVAEHHARAPHAMLAHALLCPMSPCPSALCLRAPCPHAPAPRSRTPLGLMSTCPLHLSLASCCARHLRTLLRSLPSIACAHATAYALLPRPRQCASSALFSR